MHISRKSYAIWPSFRTHLCGLSFAHVFCTYRAKFGVQSTHNFEHVFCSLGAKFRVQTFGKSKCFVPLAPKERLGSEGPKPSPSEPKQGTRTLHMCFAHVQSKRKEAKFKLSNTRKTNQQQLSLSLAYTKRSWNNSCQPSLASRKQKSGYLKVFASQTYVGLSGHRIPFLLESQKKGFQRFLQKGLSDEFQYVKKIVHGSRQFELLFHPEHFILLPPKSTPRQSILKRQTYQCELKIPLQLTNYATGEILLIWFSLCYLPLMTNNGHFIINGIPKVILHQITRSPGVYFKKASGSNGSTFHVADIIAFRGTWLRFQVNDKKTKIWVRLKRIRRLRLYSFLRCFGLSHSFINSFIHFNVETEFASYSSRRRNKKIKRLLKSEKKFIQHHYLPRLKRLNRSKYKAWKGFEHEIYDVPFSRTLYYGYNKSKKTHYTDDLEDALLNPRDTRPIPPINGFPFQKKPQFPNKNLTMDILMKKFLNPTTYNLSKSGRLRLNHILKLNISDDCTTLTAQDVLLTCYYLVQCQQGRLKLSDIDNLQYRRIRSSGELIQNQLGIGLLSFVKNIRWTLKQQNWTQSLVETQLDPLGIYKQAGGPEIEMTREESIGFFAGNKAWLDFIHPVDDLQTGRYDFNLLASESRIDKRSAKWYYYDQPDLKLVRKHKVSDLQHSSDDLYFKLKKLLRPNLVQTSLKEFFSINPLCQLMDQTNALAEITHKRRVSALGIGGVSRDNASLDMRNIHPSHYGRICPIETPEGKNAGLVNSLTVHARVTEDGFIKTPYFNVNAGGMMKDQQALLLLPQHEGDYGLLPGDAARQMGVYTSTLIPTRKSISMDSRAEAESEFGSVSPIQMISIATSTIPFMEHNDGNRALMGSNMQRQSIPNVQPTIPIVGTGFEAKVIADVGHGVYTKHSGFISYVDAKKIIVYKTVKKLPRFYFLGQTCLQKRKLALRSDYADSKSNLSPLMKQLWFKSLWGKQCATDKKKQFKLCYEVQGFPKATKQEQLMQQTSLKLKLKSKPKHTDLIFAPLKSLLKSPLFPISLARNNAFKKQGSRSNFLRSALVRPRGRNTAARGQPSNFGGLWSFRPMVREARAAKVVRNKGSKPQVTNDQLASRAYSFQLFSSFNSYKPWIDKKVNSGVQIQTTQPKVQGIKSQSHNPSKGRTKFHEIYYSNSDSKGYKQHPKQGFNRYSKNRIINANNVMLNTAEILTLLNLSIVHPFSNLFELLKVCTNVSSFNKQNTSFIGFMEKTELSYLKQFYHKSVLLTYLNRLIFCNVLNVTANQPKLLVQNNISWHWGFYSQIELNSKGLQNKGQNSFHRQGKWLLKSFVVSIWASKLASLDNETHGFLPVAPALAPKAKVWFPWSAKAETQTAAGGITSQKQNKQHEILLKHKYLLFHYCQLPRVLLKHNNLIFEFWKLLNFKPKSKKITCINIFCLERLIDQLAKNCLIPLIQHSLQRSKHLRPLIKPNQFQTALGLGFVIPKVDNDKRFNNQSLKAVASTKSDLKPHFAFGFEEANPSYFCKNTLGGFEQNDVQTFGQPMGQTLDFLQYQLFKSPKSKCNWKKYYYNSFNKRFFNWCANAFLTPFATFPLLPKPLKIQDVSFPSPLCKAQPALFQAQPKLLRQQRGSKWGLRKTKLQQNKLQQLLIDHKKALGLIKRQKSGLVTSEYKLNGFFRSNQSTYLVHRPVINSNSWIRKQDLLADNSSSQNGQLAIGKNLLVGYLPWQGYNFEDAVLFSQTVLEKDLFNSLHVSRYEVVLKNTPFGKEEFTNFRYHKQHPDLYKILTNKDLPCVTKLDCFGIIQIGKWVEPGNILVGKLSPFPYDQQIYNPYKALIFELANKKVFNYKNTSIRAPLDVHGRVIHVEYVKTVTQLQQCPLNIELGLMVKKYYQKIQKKIQKQRIKKLFSWRREFKKTYLRLNKKTQKVFASVRSVLPLQKQGTNRTRSNPLLPLQIGFLPAQKQRSTLGRQQGGRQDVFQEAKLESKGVPWVTNAHISPKFPINQRINRFLKPNNRIQTMLCHSISMNVSRKIKQNKSELFPFLSDLSHFKSLKFGLSQLNFASSGKGQKRSPVVVLSKKANKKGKKKRKVRMIQTSVPTHIQIFIAERRQIQVGDKIAGRHGNKGIISKIMPRQDMPYLPDGTPLDVVLNPLGVPSRMNVGQIYECLLGLAGYYLGQNYKVQPFDERYGYQASRSLVYSKLYEAKIKTNLCWLFNSHHPGKVPLFDGRTGDCFDQPVTVGYAYILKLIHMVDEKIHSRTNGPYALVTQQPLKGRSKNGGQRVGEMEVWAFEGFGAAYILNELLTIKSDDIVNRRTIGNKILNNSFFLSQKPESFMVLIKELQTLCLKPVLSTNRIYYAVKQDEFKTQLDCIERVRNKAR